MTRQLLSRYELTLQSCGSRCLETSRNPFRSRACDLAACRCVTRQPRCADHVRVSGSELPSREELLTLIESQSRLIEQLRAEVAELKRRLGRNSGNSSQPPSADGPAPAGGGPLAPPLPAGAWPQPGGVR